MKKREIITRKANSAPIKIKGVDLADPAEWCESKATEYRFVQYLLAFADDGVIWGKFEGNKLTLSSVLADCSPEFRFETLRELRLFGDNGELLVWKDHAGWQGRVIQDGVDVVNPDWEQATEDEHMLWGSHAQALPEGFTLLQHEAQGLKHAIPYVLTGAVKDSFKKISPPRLKVRQYLSKTGPVKIEASRLVGFVSLENNNE